MIAEISEVFTLHIEKCRADPSRYDWIIRSDQHVVRRCTYSTSTASYARKEGLMAMQELTAFWRDSR